jgi:polyferredoxin
MIAAVISVGAGILLGLLIGQDQWIGWARHGISWRNALPMLALSAVALMVPAFTGKNFYCSRLCPHGAAQTLIGMAAKKRKVLPASLHRVLQHLPWLTLLCIWGLALLGWQLAFAHAEPFEVWSTGLIAFLPAALFTIGLVAAYFLPQAYCHYGCPTGALLKFLTHAPGRWTRRDSIAAGLVAVAWVVTLF